MYVSSRPLLHTHKRDFPKCPYNTKDLTIDKPQKGKRSFSIVGQERKVFSASSYSDGSAAIDTD